MRYETVVVVLLSLFVGVASFEQTTLFYLMPFIQPELRLTNTQVGLIAQAYWVTCGLSSYALSALADITRRWRLVTVIAAFGLALFSGAAALATSFFGLLGARAMIGVIEGSVQPVAQAITALESSEGRAAINMGFVGNLGGNILGLFAAPLVLVRVANTLGWRAGFLVCVLPGLACAVLMAWRMREPVVPTRAVDVTISHESGPAAGGLREVLKFRNVWLCTALACLFVSYTSIGYQFLPLYFVDGRHMSTPQMSFLMSVLGASAVVSSLLIPMAADRIGRKPVMILVSLSAVICPLAVIYYDGPIAVLSLLVFVGTGLPGALSLFTGTIPAETVPARYISTGMGVICGVGIVLGGLFSPVIAGWSADRWGLKTGVWLLGSCALAMAIVSGGLRETRPRKPPMGMPSTGSNQDASIPN